MEPVEAINDTDHNGVFKITDPANQKVKLVQSDGTHKNIQIFDLRDLVLEPEIGA